MLPGSHTMRPLHRNIPKEYEQIYKTLSNNPKHINEICRDIKQNISKTTEDLTMLELEGLIEQLPGNMFKAL